MSSIQIVGITNGRAVDGVPDIPVLGALPEDDLPARFRAVHQWAVENGCTAGIPNFHAWDWNRHWGERNTLTGSEQPIPSEVSFFVAPLFGGATLALFARDWWRVSGRLDRRG